MRNQLKQPLVSVIVPCYNEEKTIQLLLDAIRKQTYPLNKLEVVISDAFSQDRTREIIVEYQDFHADLKVRIVDNPERTIPAGVNSAAKAAKGEILVRLDAHSEPNPEYVETSVMLLTEKKAENVGGVWQIQPGEATPIAKAIALAAAHPLGVGDAKYRVSTTAQYVDTVPFGAFYKEKFFDIGAFDETLLANEDYEFNARLRAGGGRIWMDPHIISRYYARANLRKLAIQYWRYGYWKVKMLQRFPNTLRLRQALPPLFVASVVIFTVLSAIFSIPRIILVGELISYLLVLLFACLHCVIRKRMLHCLLMPAAIIVMHFSWGAGFLASLIENILKRADKKI